MSEKPSQQLLAKKLDISNSYLSMILSGKRKCPIKFVESLQSTRGIHKVVKNDIWGSLYTQEVRGPNPLLPTTSKGQFSFRKLTKCSLDKFLTFRPDGFRIKTIGFYYYAFNNFVGYSPGPEGAISYLRSHICHGGEKYYRTLIPFQ